MDDEILRHLVDPIDSNGGQDFNELSTLSKGRWRGIYTPPQNLTVAAFTEAVVPEIRAVLPEKSGTTGHRYRNTLFEQRRSIRNSLSRPVAKPGTTAFCYRRRQKLIATFKKPLSRAVLKCGTAAF